MSSLFRHFRIHQVFGANTDVGKTILTTALAAASAQRGNKTFYLKPVSTGPLEDADDHHVNRYTSQFKELIHAECLFRYDEPVSPHLAVKMKADIEGENTAPSDKTFINAVANRIRVHANRSTHPAHMYLETAGGIHSPTLSGSTQVDAYRPLYLPTILIGDSKLGGISSTISSYESLLLRGYIIDAVLLFRDNYYQNAEYLKEYFVERGIHVATVNAPPPRLSDPKENFKITSEYYASIIRSNPQDPNASLDAVIDRLDECHSKRLQELESMPKRALDNIWWPFVQHGLVKGEKDVTVIDSAYSDFFSITNKSVIQSQSSNQSLLEPQFDGSASWWTQSFGHANPALTLAAARASGRYGHVMFPQAVHLPALKLAERLIHDGPGKGWASRAFISDNGSTGMEVALKMALRAYTLRQEEALTTEDKKQLGVLGLKGSYHGDTIGAMDACEADGVYTCEWHDAKGYWLDPPSVGIKDGEVSITIPGSLAAFPQDKIVKAQSLAWVYEVENRIHTPLAQAYAMYIKSALDSLEARDGPKLAALVIEPIVMGAGGMIFVDPLFQRVLIDTVRGRRSGSSTSWSGLPVIFDEVFVGLHRVGIESSGPLLGVYPDISVNAKILTGGLLPLAVTLASQSIFEAFLADNKADALLHGHSYTAHPIGCEVANETLSMIDKLKESQDWVNARLSWDKLDGEKSPVWSLWDPHFIKEISKLPQVRETMALGTVLAIKIQDDSSGYTSQSAQRIFLPLSNASEEEGLLSSAPGGASFGVHYRTLGDVAYFMTSLNTNSSVIRSIEDKIWSTLSGTL